MVGNRKDYDELAWQEVARQTAAHCQSERATLTAENAALREKLAERDALLREMRTSTWAYCIPPTVRDQIDALTGGDNAQG